MIAQYLKLKNKCPVLLKSVNNLCSLFCVCEREPEGRAVMGMTAESLH